MGGARVDRPETEGVRRAVAPSRPAHAKRVRAAVIAGVLLVAAALAGGCSLILNFDDSSLGSPPDASAVGGADASTSAVCSALEPNDSLASPSLVLPGTYALALCPPATDIDYIAFDVGLQQDVTIDLSFDDNGGVNDIDMRLYNAANGQMVDSAATAGPSEHIEHSAALGNQLPQGRYIIEAYQGATATASPPELPYSLTVKVGAPPVVDAGSSDGSAPGDATALPPVRKDAF